MKKSWTAIVLLCAAMLSAIGCNSGQETEVTFGTLESSNIPIYQIKECDVDTNAIMDVFIGMTPKEAEEYICCEIHEDYEVGNQIFHVRDNASTGKTALVFYGDETDGAYSCYTTQLLSMFQNGMQNKTMRQLFPQEDTKEYSKEEAIEACRPYAEVCGYTDCEVSVYAATRDILRNTQATATGGKADGIISAPGSDFNYVSCKTLTDLQIQMETLDPESEEYKKASQQYNLKSYYRRRAAIDRYLSWEYEHEAFILTYQPRLDGYAMEEQQELLTIIYAPKYGPVYIKGSASYEIAGKVGETEVISQEEAWKKVFELKGYYTSDKRIRLKKIALVYVQEAKTGRGIPCWNIEYVNDEVWNRVVLDAATGKEYKTGE